MRVVVAPIVAALLLLVEETWVEARLVVESAA
jgi:hypothetical protein